MDYFPGLTPLLLQHESTPNHILDQGCVGDKIPHASLLDGSKFFKDGCMPLITLRASKCLSEGWHIRKSQVIQYYFISKVRFVANEFTDIFELGG